MLDTREADTREADTREADTREAYTREASGEFIVNVFKLSLSKRIFWFFINYRLTLLSSLMYSSSLNEATISFIKLSIWVSK